MKINIPYFVDYSLLTLFVGTSGVPYISDPKMSVLLFIMLSLIFFQRKRHVNAHFILFVMILFVITLLQALQLDFISLMTTIGLFTIVLNAYFMVKVLQDKFVDYFVTIMYYIAVISLVFFVPFFFSHALGKFVMHSVAPIFDPFNIAHSPHVTILVYNLSHIDIFRNSGPFWEPGAFAGYLLIAFMFNFVTKTDILNRKNIVLLLAIFTTFSTTAFLALFVFLFFLYYKQVKNIALKLMVVITLLTIAFFAYTSLDFLGKKIETQIAQETSLEVLRGKVTGNTGRFISIVRDMKAFKGHEWIGRGGNNATRFDIPSGGKLIITSVGLTDVIVKYGIIFFIIIVYFLYRSICAYVSVVSLKQSYVLICIAIFIPVLMLLVSEVYFNYSLYWSLLFLKFVYYLNNKGSYT